MSFAAFGSLAVMTALTFVSCGADPSSGAATPVSEGGSTTSSVSSEATTSQTAMTTTTAGSEDISLHDLIGVYVGKLIRKDEPGTPDTFHTLRVRIFQDDGLVVGELTHGPVGVNSIDGHGNVVMPLTLSLEGDVLTMRWDDSVGPILDDTTFAQCDWKVWEMRVMVEERGRLLKLVDGYVEAELPPDTDASEWYLGCPADQRALIRMTLTRQ